MLCFVATAALSHRQGVCGAAPSPLNSTTPNVLIIGDSISMGFGVSATDTGYGYGLNVKKILGGPYPEFYSKTLAGGLATVQHNGGFGSNGGSTGNGVLCMDQWVGGKHWDVITINVRAFLHVLIHTHIRAFLHVLIHIHIHIYTYL